MFKEFTKKNLWLIYVLPLLILAFFAIAYWPAFQKLMIRWKAGDNSYCYLIVPLFLYLLFDRKDQFQFGEFSWSFWGLVPVVLSVLLIIVGEMGSVETLLYAGLWGCVVGLTVILYGWRVRHLFFPLFILLFIVPLPPFINRILTFKLKLAASKLSVAMLRMTGVSVVREGNIIDIGISQLQVVDACSGLRYLMPLFLMALLVGYFFNKKLWQRTVIVLVVIPLSVFVNTLRIWITGILTVKGHEELAQSFFHDFSGWLIFMLAAGLLIATALVLKKINVRGLGSGVRDQDFNDLTQKDHLTNQPPDHSTKANQSTNSNNITNITNQTHLTNQPFNHLTKIDNSTNWKKPVLITTILCLLFTSSGWAIKVIPSARNLPNRMAFDSFPMQIGEWQGNRHYIPKKILDQLWCDDYISATYSRPDSANHINLLIPFYEYQGTRHTAHAPQSCMLGGGWALFNSGEKFINLIPHGRIKIMTMTWEKGDYKLLGSYFFFQRGRVITSPWMNKFYLMWDAFLKRRTDGALVRVEMTVAPGQPMEAAYETLEGFIANLWPILPQYVPN